MREKAREIKEADDGSLNWQSQDSI